MKLIIAIAHDRDHGRVANALIKNGFTFTKLGSTGGFLRQGSTTILIGVDDDEVANAMDILKNYCCKSECLVSIPTEPAPSLPLGGMNSQPLMAETGGGIAFVLNVDRVERF